MSSSELNVAAIGGELKVTEAQLPDLVVGLIKVRDAMGALQMKTPRSSHMLPS